MILRTHHLMTITKLTFSDFLSIIVKDSLFILIMIIDLEADDMTQLSSAILFFGFSRG